MFPREVKTWTNNPKPRAIRIGAKQGVLKRVEERQYQKYSSRREFYKKSPQNAIPTTEDKKQRRERKKKGNRNECVNCH